MATKPSKVISRPVLGKDKVSEADIEKFIAGAPDAGNTLPAELKKKSTRKKAISLTIDEDILRNLDAKAAALGLSRAAAFALAVSRFVAAEEREARR